MNKKIEFNNDEVFDSDLDFKFNNKEDLKNFINKNNQAKNSQTKKETKSEAINSSLEDDKETLKFRKNQEFSEEDFLEIEMEDSGQEDKINKELKRRLVPKKSYFLIVTAFTLLIAGLIYVVATDLISSIYNIVIGDILLNLSYLTFLLLTCKVIIKELRTLKKLREREEKTTTFYIPKEVREYQKEIVLDKDIEVKEVSKPQDINLYNYLESVISDLRLSKDSHALQRYYKQINAYTTSEQMLQIFEKEILEPIDKKAKKVVNDYAIRDLIFISLTPFHTVHLLFVLYRNFTMIKEIAELYGLQITYISRITLLKDILINIAFTSITELLQEVSTTSISSNIIGKLSNNIAQGLSIGFLTSRLGIRAIHFSRPIPFNFNEEPKAKYFFSNLYSSARSLVLKNNKEE